MLDAAMTGEIENGLLAEDSGVEIARMDQELVIFGFRFRDDLAIGIDNQAAADQWKPVLDAGLRWGAVAQPVQASEIIWH